MFEEASVVDFLFVENLILNNMVGETNMCAVQNLDSKK